MDFAPQIGHAAVRSFVLGERCADPTYTPTDEEVSAMSDVIQEAVEAGAAGFAGGPQAADAASKAARAR